MPPRIARSAQDGIEPSVGSDGNSIDITWTEPAVGPYKTEVMPSGGPGRHPEPMKFVPPDCADRFTHRRLLETIGSRPPAEAKPAYHHRMVHTALVA